MASAAPTMPFLRPMALPRPQTIRHFLRFSTSSPCQKGPKLAWKSVKEGMQTARLHCLMLY